MNKVKPYDIVLNAVCIILAFILLLPFYNVVIRSVATPNAIAQQPFYLIPTSFDLAAYRKIFEGGQIIQSFMVSVFVTVVGTLLSMVVTVMGAYALSKKTLPGRKIILYGIVFTMFFNGGLVPYYLNIKSLGLVNNVWVMILPTTVYTFYFIMMLNYFRSVPESLIESAKIDGATHFITLARIILPISKPILAAISLFYGVQKWNAWWEAMLFVSDRAIYPMQLFLREMLIDISRLASDSQAADMTATMKEVTPDGLKMATVIVTTLPIMLLYPFLQKHFAAGSMMGAIKE